MSTDYDAVAEEYKRSKLAPWRTYLERYSLLNLLGEVRGKSVLDLACGEGFYSRLVRERGAGRVVGVDWSSGYCQVKWNSRVLEAKSVVGRT